MSAESRPRDAAAAGDRPPARAGLLARARNAPYTVLAAATLAVAAYLCVVNLDYAALWHDEAPTALIGRNLLERGDITGWDGRNLTGGTNGRTLNDDLRDVLPPLMYVANAASFALFGVSETAARIMPALFGIMSLALLYLLLRQHLRHHPRLIFFCLLFAAWSPQLLLYFRQSRYYAFMALALIAAFYLYELWWKSGRTWALGGLTLAAALAFFNHYAGGAATMLALAAWHLLFRRRETTPRQWLVLAACGGIVVVLGVAYFVWVGLIGGGRSGFLAYTGITGLEEYRGTIPPLVLRLAIYTRDLFTADWLSWPVFLWFAGTLSFSFMTRRGRARPPGNSTRSSRSAGSTAAHAPRDELPAAAVGRVVLMGALFALFSAALSPQPVWVLQVADLRYYMGALPLLLPMKGLFVEWLWRRWRVAGGAALAVLLCTSAGAWPFNIRMIHTGERTLGLHLVQFVREIHRPYRDSLRVVSDYLLEHATQDDLVYVPRFSDREALTFTTGHRVRYCCVLHEDSPLPQDAIAGLGSHLAATGTVPDWIVLFGKPKPEYMEKITDRFAVVARPDVFVYPTQRPEINLHAFAPLPAETFGVHILQRKTTDRLEQAADRLISRGQYEEAAATYRAMLEIDPDSASAHAGLGSALFRLGRYAEALHAMTQATALQPDLPRAGARYRLMGQAAQELGRSEAAAEHYERALKLDPHDTLALDRLAMVRFGQQHYAAALDLYSRLIEVHPDAAQTHANLGATLYYLGRLDEAIASLERSLPGSVAGSGAVIPGADSRRRATAHAITAGAE